MVFTFAQGDKQQKSSSDGLGQLKAKAEELGIKTLSPYLVDSITHVVANKRNTAKGLQALINGKYIVTEAFLDAIIKVASSPNNGDPPPPSPLEEDYEAHWPDAMQYLPSPGKEPNPRDQDYFAPNASRVSIFEGFTFVFGDEKQHEALVDTITNGGAKCLLFNIEMGKTPLREFVEYVRAAAGKKGTGSYEEGKTKGGTVVVRFRSKGNTADWAIEFLRAVDRELGQRSIEQNEFLDAILTNDSSGLRRPLEEEEVESGALLSTNDAANARSNGLVQEDSQSQPPSAQPQPESKSPPRTSRFRTRITQKRFKGYDSAISPPASPQRPPQKSLSPIEKASQSQDQQQDADPIGEQSQGLFIQDSQMSLAQPRQTSGGPSRKRPAPETDARDNESRMDELLPGTRAMKKRRLEMGESSTKANRQELANVKESPIGQTRGAKSKGKSEKQQEIDIRTKGRAYVQNRDKQREDSDADMLLHENNGDLSTLRNLAIVEETNIVEPHNRRRRSRRSSQNDANGETSIVQDHEWNDEWNGRRNFKRFRRKGEPETNRGYRVIVPLEEVKQKNFGIGEAYWLETNTSNSGRRKKGGDGSQFTGDDDTQRSRNNQPIVLDDDDDDDGNEMDAEPTSGQRSRGQPPRGTKRRANEGISQQSSAKRRRRLRLGEDEDEDGDNDEELEDIADLTRPTSRTTRNSQSQRGGKGTGRGRGNQPKRGGLRSRDTQDEEDDDRQRGEESSSDEEDELKFRFKRNTGAARGRGRGRGRGAR